MASGVDTVRAAVEGRLKSNWSLTPISWPGVEFDAAEGDWIRSTLVFGTAAMETMSSAGVNTIPGFLLLDLFTVSKSGLGTLYARVDTLRDLFDRVTLGAAEFGAASGPREVSDEQWQGLQIEVPFIIEENS